MATSELAKLSASSLNRPPGPQRLDRPLKVQTVKAPAGGCLAVAMSCQAHSPVANSSPGVLPANFPGIAGPWMNICTFAERSGSRGLRYCIPSATTCGVTVTPSISPAGAIPHQARKSRANASKFFPSISGFSPWALSVR